MEEWVIRLAVESLRDELESAVLYGRLSRLVRDERLAGRLREFAGMEGMHAAFWIDFLRRRGFDPGRVRPSRIRVFFYILLFHVLGLGLTIKLLEAGEAKAIETYARLLEYPGLTGEEREGLRRLLADELLHEEDFVEAETRLREFLEHVRDAVLGMSDGVVEVLSVTAGLAGAYGEPLYVALGGLIVGAGGALSMGIGAFTSVRAQRQVRLGVLGRLSAASKHLADVLAQRVGRFMRGKGFSGETADRIAAEALRNRKLLARIIAEEGYGVREEALENPGKAGLYTGVFYVLGAILPLLPYFLRLPIPYSLPLSFILAGLAMAFTGFIIAVSAGLSVKAKMVELAAAGLGAATITYFIGLLASMLFGIEVG